MEQCSLASNKPIILPIAISATLVVLLTLSSIYLLGNKRDDRQSNVNTSPTPQSIMAAAGASGADQTATTISLQTPSPYVVRKASDAQSNPVPTEPPIVATATEAVVMPTATADMAQAALSPTRVLVRQPSGAAILPNGVRYGDHKPNLPDRIVRIASPNIKLDTPVYEVYATSKGEWEVADYAAGHNYNAKNPGEGGNIVLSGHNNWRGEVFRYLEFLKPGNEIWVWTLNGKQYKYRVEQVEKLKEKGASLAQRLSNGKVMDPTPSEQLTLITCWPYTTYTHRLIVIATPMQ